MPRNVIVAVVCIVVGVAVATVNLDGSAKTPFVNQDLVDQINNGNFPWTASTQQGARVANADEDSLKRLMGVKAPAMDEVVEGMPFRVFSEEELAQPIPDSFDATQKWPHCKTMTHIRDQSDCGSCWAVAAAESISDRYCTYGGPKDLLVSAAQVMECCNYCGYGCNGGAPHLAWMFWRKNGLVSDACQPYPFPKCEHYWPMNVSHYPRCDHGYVAPACPGNTCNSTGVSHQLHFGNNSWRLRGVKPFQLELMQNGPFEVAFSVYGDFPAYKSGVYVKTSKVYLGGHAVKMLGWGTLNGVPYWKIANSWNSDWGDNGYFLIKRGVNECGIENEGSAGEPKLPGWLRKANEVLN